MLEIAAAWVLFWLGIMLAALAARILFPRSEN